MGESKGPFVSRISSGVRADFVQVDTSMTFDRALIQFLIDRQRRF